MCSSDLALTIEQIEEPEDIAARAGEDGDGPSDTELLLFDDDNDLGNINLFSLPPAEVKLAVERDTAVALD